MVDKQLTETSGVWKPATQLQKMQALIMLSKLPMQNHTDLDVVKAVYFIALEGVTAFGLEQATKAIIRGSLGHAFMPSPPELRQECERIMDVERDKLVRQRRLTWAEDGGDGLPDDEARQRMNELWMKARPMFGSEPKPDQPGRAPPRTWREVEADLLAHANDPIEVTPLLEKKLAAARKQDEALKT